MYKRNRYKVLSNRPLTADVWEMKLEGDTQYITVPGQFVNIELAGRFLRRPISVCDYDERTLVLVYKVIGEGTRQMSEILPGSVLDLLTGLGNGFTLQKQSRRPLLVGGGVGVPPLYRLAKELLAAGRQTTVVLGFNRSDEVFYRDEFAALGARVYLATADGSAGMRGFVTDVLRSAEIGYDYFYACGPLPMLRALCETLPSSIGGQLSFEERMGCGFGACMGCTCKTKDGYKRICKDGPVLKREEIVWE